MREHRGEAVGYGDSEFAKMADQLRELAEEIQTYSKTNGF
jgi:hypothetical protein